MSPAPETLRESGKGREALGDLKREIVLSPWLQEDENAAEYQEFRESLWTDYVEPAVEDMNDRVEPFFESSTHADYKRFHDNVLLENKELAERMRDDLLKKYKLDAAQVSAESLEAQAQLIEELQKVYETTSNTLEKVFSAYANRSRPEVGQLARDDDAELASTLNYDEMLLLRNELPRFYQSITAERMEFFVRIESVGEETVENFNKLKALVLEILREKSPQEAVLKEMVLKDRIQRMTSQERQTLIQQITEEADGPTLVNQLIEHQIVTPLDVQRTLESSSEDARYAKVQQKISDGTYRKEYEKKDKEAAEALEALKKTQQGGRLIDLFAFSPAKGATLIFGTLYGAVGLFLNTLINLDLIKAGKFSDFFKNEALWINAGVLAGSLEYGTSKGHLGTGMLSRFLAKPRGQAVTDRIGEEKVALFMEQYQRMPGIANYLRNHFDDMHTYLNGLETSLEEKKAELQTMEDEDIDTSDPSMEQLRKQQIETKKREASKTFFDLIKEDLGKGDAAPEVLKNIGEFDGFNREETITKIAEMYFLAVKFTAPSQETIETKEDFEALLADMELT